MRYTHEVRLRLTGDREEAQRLIPYARTVLGGLIMRNEGTGKPLAVIQHQVTISDVLIRVGMTDGVPWIHIDTSAMRGGKGEESGAWECHTGLFVQGEGSEEDPNYFLALNQLRLYERTRRQYAKGHWTRFPYDPWRESSPQPDPDDLPWVGPGASSPRLDCFTQVDPVDPSILWGGMMSSCGEADPRGRFWVAALPSGRHYVYSNIGSLGTFLDIEILTPTPYTARIQLPSAVGYTLCDVHDSGLRVLLAGHAASALMNPPGIEIYELATIVELRLAYEGGWSHTLSVLRSADTSPPISVYDFVSLPGPQLQADTFYTNMLVNGPVFVGQTGWAWSADVADIALTPTRTVQRQLYRVWNGAYFPSWYTLTHNSTVGAFYRGDSVQFVEILRYKEKLPVSGFSKPSISDFGFSGRIEVTTFRTLNPDRYTDTVAGEWAWTVPATSGTSISTDFTEVVVGGQSVLSASSECTTVMDHPAYPVRLTIRPRVNSPVTSYTWLVTVDAPVTNTAISTTVTTFSGPLAPPDLPHPVVFSTVAPGVVTHTFSDWIWGPTVAMWELSYRALLQDNLVLNTVDARENRLRNLHYSDLWKIGGVHGPADRSTLRSHSHKVVASLDFYGGCRNMSVWLRTVAALPQTTEPTVVIYPELAYRSPARVQDRDSGGFTMVGPSVVYALGDETGPPSEQKLHNFGSYNPITGQLAYGFHRSVSWAGTWQNLPWEVCRTPYVPQPTPAYAFGVAKLLDPVYVPEDAPAGMLGTPLPNDDSPICQE
jgi:hypothetical protein